ncbi:MAG: ATP-binding cassette domain-containing protein, partial [Coprococcus sp.]
GSVIEIRSKNDEFGVLMIFSMFDYSRQKWNVRYLEDGTTNQVYIGRAVGNSDIAIPSVQMSRQHGVFTRTNGNWVYQDLNSKNGTFINRMAVKGSVVLKEKDIIQIVNIKIIYTRGMLIYNLPNSGCELKIDNISKVVKCPKTDPSYNQNKHMKCILDRVNVTIEPSEFVAVLGGSGAGKTTFLNCINGYEEATSGAVYMDGINLYTHKDQLKKQIGYVPQEDLLRNGISVRQTLRYIAKMRLPKDINKTEREQRIDQTFNMLGLDAKCQASDVKKVSGGQRKRVSIASELVSDPPILFLDEPTSGLDPETETNLISSLKNLAHVHEKTVIVITHTLKNIDMFDKILFFAPGGKLCFAGSPEEAYELFNVKDMTDVYKIIREHTDEYDRYYRQSYMR